VPVIYCISPSAERIDSLKKVFGMSFYELALVCNLSRGTLQGWARGSGRCRETSLVKFNSVESLSAEWIKKGYPCLDCFSKGSLKAIKVVLKQRNINKDLLFEAGDSLKEKCNLDRKL
jgi:hypothetical protein